MEVVTKANIDDYKFYCPSCKQDTLFHSRYSFHRTEIVSCSSCKKEYSKEEICLETLKKHGVKITDKGDGGLTDMIRGIIEFFF